MEAVETRKITVQRTFADFDRKYGRWLGSSDR
jgi:hypothetical protein